MENTGEKPMKRCTKTMKPIEKMKTKFIIAFSSSGRAIMIDDEIKVKINEIIDRINDLPKRKGKREKSL